MTYVIFLSKITSLLLLSGKIYVFVSSSRCQGQSHHKLHSLLSIQCSEVKARETTTNSENFLIITLAQLKDSQTVLCSLDKHHDRLNLSSVVNADMMLRKNIVVTWVE